MECLTKMLDCLLERVAECRFRPGCQNERLNGMLWLVLNRDAGINVLKEAGWSVCHG